jgi:uncharacterized membrane-anchored protein
LATPSPSRQQHPRVHGTIQPPTRGIADVLTRLARNGGVVTKLKERRADGMNRIQDISSSKVPEVTVIFWIIKIGATTLGETGGDALSMTMHLGYAISSVIFFTLFIVAVTAQVTAKSFHALLYWAVIVATTTVGTTMADLADRSLGIGYVGGSLMLFTILMLVLGVWWFSVGSVSVSNITSPKVETFYWVTILFSNTLGTALGDFLADTSGLGYEGGALVFAGALALIAAAYFWTKISHTLLFWLAFILTRPLGATVGDLLTKPHASGGLDLSRFSSSAAIALFIIACILLVPQRAGSHPGEDARSA